MNINEAQELLKKYGQEHILEHWEKINETQKQTLLEQIANIDFENLAKLYKEINEKSEDKSDAKLEAIHANKREEVENSERYIELGEKCIKEGKLAFVTMAGGQGTRLGFNGPKGAYILDTENGKSLFELLCDTLKLAKDKYGVIVPWYIMTSRENNRETVDFFEQNSYFDYGKENVFFCVQGELPMLFEDGTCVMESMYKIREAADGHGRSICCT